MNSKCTLFSFWIVFGLFIFSSCAKKNYLLLPQYQFKSTNQAANYSELNYWAAHPWKWDPSDSIPTPFKNGAEKDTSVDVFFIHPTSFTNKDDSAWNASIDDATLNYKTDYSSILYQASAFNEHARIFAPRYRQAHIRSYYTNDHKQAKNAFDIAYQDVKNAFEYYLAHYNNNRPIIIASHSQGTTHAGRLIKEYFENKPLRKQLICAYIIGMPIPKNYFDNFYPCEDSLNTGCFVGWRTFKRGYYDPYILKNESYECYVINPLNWSMEKNIIVSRKMNTGAVLRNFNKVNKHVLDAEIYKNVLWTCKPKFFGSVLIRNKNYHIGDINLFYTNIRDNVSTRIKQYNLK